MIRMHRNGILVTVPLMRISLEARGGFGQLGAIIIKGLNVESKKTLTNTTCKPATGGGSKRGALAIKIAGCTVRITNSGLKL